MGFLTPTPMICNICEQAFSCGCVIERTCPECKDKLFLVLAGTYEQYRQWCAFRGLNERHAVYLHHVRDMMGRRPENSKVIYIGTWYERKDAYDIEEYLRGYGFNVR